jgi:ABC-2 type transport system permease protein
MDEHPTAGRQFRPRLRPGASGHRTLMSTLSDLTRSRELLTNLTLRELRGKYKRSLLGWSWSLVNPLATMGIYTIVFAVFLKVPIPPGHPSGLKVFPLYLLVALLPWNFLGNAMTGGMEALVGNANLIKKVYFPRQVLVLASLGSWLFSLGIELGVLAIALLIAGNMVLPWLPLVLLVVLLQCTYVLGVSLLLSVLNVYFRDVRHFVGIFLQLWFYMTPIVYPVSLVPEHKKILGVGVAARSLYELNPMVRFVAIYRNLLYDLRFPALADVLYLVVVAAVTLAVGWIVFEKLEPRLAEEL